MAVYCNLYSGICLASLASLASPTLRMRCSPRTVLQYSQYSAHQNLYLYRRNKESWPEVRYPTPPAAPAVGTLHGC
ncbi:hypothetical protein F5Y08DRAFT_316218 [Xylaria arbuscula]|nr:hypothetical protein F5Y08DRAFT_316218 [Xylaria arbuscula]